MEFPVLETDRLSLVNITKSYVNDIYSIFSNEEVVRYYGMNAFNGLTQSEKMIESFQTRYENQQAIRWGLIEKNTNKLIGTIGLNNLLIAAKRTEIGYDLLPEYWRKGYASEAINEVITYCFQKLELFRIGAIIFPENIGSISLIEKFGFQIEGKLRGYLFQNNQSYDVNVYSLLKTEWEK